MIIQETTHKGFIRLEFEDLYENQCSLQESSLVTEYAIWFGINNNRMHLTQNQIEQLLPILERFVETGGLIE